MDETTNGKPATHEGEVDPMRRFLFQTVPDDICISMRRVLGGWEIEGVCFALHQDGSGQCEYLVVGPCDATLLLHDGKNVNRVLRPDRGGPQGRSGRVAAMEEGEIVAVTP